MDKPLREGPPGPRRRILRFGILIPSARRVRAKMYSALARGSRTASEAVRVCIGVGEVTILTGHLQV